MSTAMCQPPISGSCDASGLQPSAMAFTYNSAPFVRLNPRRLAFRAFDHLQNNLVRTKTV
jgi:hypothetical protein